MWTYREINRPESMFPHTVTLYKTGEEGPPSITVLEGVLLEAPRAVGTEAAGHTGADSPQLYVPFAVKATDGVTGQAKAYAGPAEWERAGDPAGLWTLPLDGSGYFVKGEVVEPDLDRQEMEARHDGVYSIVSVTERDYGSSAMRHWQIGGA